MPETGGMTGELEMMVPVHYRNWAGVVGLMATLQKTNYASLALPWGSLSSIVVLNIQVVKQ